MKLKDDIDILAFLMNVKTCREDVYYNSAEGDHLDLKSVLSQYILTANARDGKLREGTIQCDNPQDYEILQEYLVK